MIFGVEGPLAILHDQRHVKAFCSRRWSKSLSALLLMHTDMGSFDCVGVRFANANFAQDDSLFFIDSPANSIFAPHFSAKSSQRGFFDSIKAIFFARTQPFSCF